MTRVQAAHAWDQPSFVRRPIHAMLPELVTDARAFVPIRRYPSTMGMGYAVLTAVKPEPPLQAIVAMPVPPVPSNTARTSISIAAT